MTQRKQIPARFIAVAAAAASEFHKEEPEDIFDAEATSRARYVAVEAIRTVFPNYNQVCVAAHFNLPTDSWVVARRMESARCSKWWNPWEVQFIVKLLRALDKELSRNEPSSRAREPFVGIEEEQRAEVFVPRKVPSPDRLVKTRIFTAQRARNVTASLCGDPPAGRREMLAAMDDGRSYARREDRA